MGWTNNGQTYTDGVRKEFGNRIDPQLRTSVLIELNCNFSSLFSPSHPAYSSFEGLCNEKLLLDIVESTVIVVHFDKRTAIGSYGEQVLR